MALVLCTGVNPVLNETRRLLLERAGHTVVTAMNEDALVAACQQHAFDIAVIGQMISPMEKKRMYALIREHSPTAKVLELHQVHVSRVLEDADGWLAVPAEVPQQLAESVATLAAKRTA
jgi:CheY-like chemotaxis protein